MRIYLVFYDNRLSSLRFLPPRSQSTKYSFKSQPDSAKVIKARLSFFTKKFIVEVMISTHPRKHTSKCWEKQPPVFPDLFVLMRSIHIRCKHSEAGVPLFHHHIKLLQKNVSTLWRRLRWRMYHATRMRNYFPLKKVSWPVHWIRVLGLRPATLGH